MNYTKHSKYWGGGEGGIAITRGRNNNEPPINNVVKFIQVDDKLFKLDEE
jgi:hypothetical protein